MQLLIAIPGYSGLGVDPAPRIGTPQTLSHIVYSSRDACTQLTYYIGNVCGGAEIKAMPLRQGFQEGQEQSFCVIAGVCPVRYALPVVRREVEADMQSTRVFFRVLLDMCFKGLKVLPERTEFTRPRLGELSAHA